MNFKNTATVAAVAALLLFSGHIPARAAVGTLYYYDAIKFKINGDSTFNRWSTESGNAYNQLITQSPSAATAIYYECLRNAISGYFSHIGAHYDNHYKWLAIIYPEAATAYIQYGFAIQSDYQSISEVYRQAYSSYASPGNWGANFSDHSDFHRHLSTSSLVITSDIYAPAVAAFAGSHFQTALLYQAAGEAVFDRYEELGRTFYYIWLAFAPDSAPYMYQTELVKGLNAKNIYDWYSLRYRELVTINE